jgi:hypothetical protein
VAEDLYVYMRDAEDGHPAVVILSRSEEEESLTISLPSDLEGSSLRDVLGGTVHRVESGSLGPTPIPPRTAMVLVHTGTCDDP